MQGIIIGFGNMGQTHYQRFLDLGISIPYIIETDKSKTKLLRAKGVQAYRTLSEVPASQEIKFIAICSPTYLHYLHLQECIKMSKAIFVEKPIVLTKTEANKLRTIKYPLPIFVGEVEHYNPQLYPFLNYSKIPTRIEVSRTVNLDFFLRGTTPWFLDEKLSGGIVLDLMIHDINLLVSKYGKPTIKEVAFSSVKYNCPDEVRVVLCFSGFDAYLTATWTAALQPTPISVDIKLYFESGYVKNIRHDSTITREKRQYQDAYYLELKEFVKAINTGITPYPVSTYLDAMDVALEVNAFPGKDGISHEPL